MNLVQQNQNLRIIKILKKKTRTKLSCPPLFKTFHEKLKTSSRIDVLRTAPFGFKVRNLYYGQQMRQGLNFHYQRYSDAFVC